MSRKPTSKRTRPKPKAVLRLPDLDQAKSAVVNSLTSADAQRGYRHAIDEFVEWYCSEPRLSFSRTVVLRYRIHLESRNLAPGTINLRLGAVRRLAYEAADCGLLKAEWCRDEHPCDKDSADYPVELPETIAKPVGELHWTEQHRACTRDSMRQQPPLKGFVVLPYRILRMHQKTLIVRDHVGQHQGYGAKQ